MLEELISQLESIGYPLAYSHFKNSEDTPPPEPPFMVYMFSSSDDLMADNYNYAEISYYTVELYTDKKDLASEKLVEDKFKEMKISYTKLETWIGG